MDATQARIKELNEKAIRHWKTANGLVGILQLNETDWYIITKDFRHRILTYEWRTDHWKWVSSEDAFGHVIEADKSQGSSVRRMGIGMIKHLKAARSTIKVITATNFVEESVPTFAFTQNGIVAAWIPDHHRYRVMLMTDHKLHCVPAQYTLSVEDRLGIQQIIQQWTGQQTQSSYDIVPLVVDGIELHADDRLLITAGYMQSFVQAQTHVGAEAWIGQIEPEDSAGRYDHCEVHYKPDYPGHPDSTNRAHVKHALVAQMRQAWLDQNKEQQ